MAERPVAAGTTTTIRVDILKELQQLIDNREYRDRIEKSPLAEAKGREHWVLHLLLRAQETEQIHLDTLIGSAYSNLLARLQTIDDRVAHLDEVQAALDASVQTRLAALDTQVGERLETSLSSGTEKLSTSLTTQMNANLDRKWQPVGESIETFALGSKQLLKGIDDTFKATTQMRLLLSENARRLTDLGRDLIALEETLKLVLGKTVEEAFAPIEQRLAAVEAQLGLGAPAPGKTNARNDAEKSPSSAGSA